MIPSTKLEKTSYSLVRSGLESLSWALCLSLLMLPWRNMVVWCTEYLATLVNAEDSASLRDRPAGLSLSNIISAHQEWRESVVHEQVYVFQTSTRKLGEIPIECLCKHL